MRQKIMRLFFILLPLLVIGGAIYGYKIKTEIIPYPGDVSETAILYYRGLGFSNTNSWFGKIKTKIALPDNAEYLFSHGKVYRYQSFYPSGKLETESPVVEVFDNEYMMAGIAVSYFENGQISMLDAGRPRRPSDHVDCDQVPHGIYRSFERDGSIVADKYYLDGNECSKEQWLEHLKKHPEDIKYGK